MTTSTSQTIVAIADGFYHTHADLFDLSYSKYKDAVGGFPGIWQYVGDFALALDNALSESWGSGDREFIDDVDHASYYLANYVCSNGFTTLPTQLVARYINPRQDPWIDDPNHPSSDWRNEVVNNDTRLGYLDWVAAQKEKE